MSSSESPSTTPNSVNPGDGVATPKSDVESTRLQQLQTDEERKLLDTIDALREYGLGELTDLPQLIVCGGQSTGKSSLLEAVSGVPFPRNATLCTRFATEVVLRRNPSPHVRVSILPGPKRSDSDKSRLREFDHQIKDVGDLPELMAKATAEMGLQGDSGSEFSQDVLKLEVSGPTQPQLTIVDLPGLIQSTADGKEESDIVLVENIVTEYMKNPRSVILAVIAANNDPANQMVLRKAKEVDPNGDRTLGIITKPDLVYGSDERNMILSYARNEVRALKLGWHVVRNAESKDPEAVSPAVRDQQELDFFRKSAFKANVSKKMDVGAINLRKRLSKILFEQVRKCLPSLLEDFDSGIVQCREELRQLGPGRPELADQREYLIKISQEFFVLTKSAVRGTYDDAFFRDKAKPQRKLCAVLMNLHDEFAENMRNNGSKWRVLAKDEDMPDPAPANTRTRAQAIESARENVKSNRGRELPGLPAPAVMHELFVEYSAPWRQLALDHINDVQIAIEIFLQEALEHIGGKDLGQKLQNSVFEAALAKTTDNAKEMLEKLLSVHQELPMTFNAAFQRKALELFTNNSREELLGDIESKYKGKFPNAPLAELLQFLRGEYDAKPPPSLVTDRGNRDAAELALDIMQVHYQIALDLYIDNVPTLAIWAPLVRELPNIFAPEEAIKLDNDLVKHVAGDSEEVDLARKELTKRLAVLTKGMKETSKHVSRSTLPVRNKSLNEASSLSRDSGAASTGPVATPQPTRTSAALSSSASNKTAAPGQAPLPPVAPTSLFANLNSKPASASTSTFSWLQNSAASNPNTTPGTGVFGSPATAAPPGSGLFGSLSSSKPSPSPTGLFGSTAAATPSGSGLFGSHSGPKPEASRTSLFGSSAKDSAGSNNASPSPNPTASVPNLFGGSAPKPVSSTNVGASAASGSLFGGSGGLGSSSSGGSGGFGSGNSPWASSGGGAAVSKVDMASNPKASKEPNPVLSSNPSSQASKRGLSAYMFFANDKRDSVRAENPNIAFGEVGKILGERWKALSPSEREPYEQKAKADKERYEAEKARLG